MFYGTICLFSGAMYGHCGEERQKKRMLAIIDKRPSNYSWRKGATHIRNNRNPISVLSHPLFESEASSYSVKFLVLYIYDIHFLNCSLFSLVVPAQFDDVLRFETFSFRQALFRCTEQFMASTAETLINSIFIRNSFALAGFLRCFFFFCS